MFLLNNSQRFRKRLPFHRRTPKINERYSKVNALIEKIETSEPYQIHVMTDTELGIDSCSPEDCLHERKMSRTLMGSSKCHIAEWVFAPNGSKCNHCVYFRVERGATAVDQRVVAACNTTAADTPISLSRMETYDQIRAIRSCTGAKKIVASCVLNASGIS